MKNVKRVKVKIFQPASVSPTGEVLEWEKPRVRIYQTLPGKRMDDGAFEDICEKVADEIDKEFPSYDFRLVKVGRGEFNFVYHGLRGSSAGQHAT
jgi:hypothetical protein